jgi:Zn-dependent protease
MDPNFLAFGFLEYVVFLLSTTCHEASHALVAKWGGDTTAAEGGQVSLNPIPHIRREIFGMVVLPLIGILSKTGLIGYASAPYNPAWSIQYPKRSGLMSLAGPAANFALAIAAGAMMRIGLATGIFLPGSLSSDSFFTDKIVQAASGDIAAGVATILSVLFSLNLLLGCFNLIPIPPFDGFGVLYIFTNSEGALRLLQLRAKLRGFGMLIAILIASQLIGYVYGPLLLGGIRFIYLFYHFPQLQL